MSISSELEPLVDHLVRRPVSDLEPSAVEPSRARRFLRRTAQIALGLGLGLILGEAAFWARDGGSFPHVNFYVADAELGARLQPNTKMKFRLGENPSVPVTINAQGFRGDDWPEPQDTPERAVMVFGDSQVFGLGVGDDETFSAELAQISGRPVFNAGVPTYGPPEYLALARELLAEREVDTVVYVINFLNDPFELDRPNVERHAIWDGWAVRLETAPEPGEVRDFPGRRWLMSRSHLVYAARRWWHGREAQTWEDLSRTGLPSEGQWDELLVNSERSRAAEGARVEELEAAQRARRQAREQAVQARYAVDHADEELQKIRALIAQQRGPKKHYLSGWSSSILRYNPGDIVRMTYGEGSRSVQITADMYGRAVAERERVEAENRESGRRHRERKAALEAERDRLLAEAKSSDGRARAEELERVARELDEAARAARPERVALSVFEPHLRELQELCDSHGAALVVVALPIDVQVSRDEWLKYGVHDGPDMSPTRVLLEDLVLDAEVLGIEAFDATPALREAEPGAFLHGDIHMTPKGHAALAEAIAKAISRAHRG